MPTVMTGLKYTRRQKQPQRLLSDIGQGSAEANSG
uniref:Uncharacterized protein n=1 Tax=Arundo donax TaxID=35708 RepID=A0A0A8ZLI8_ARUDO